MKRNRHWQKWQKQGYDSGFARFHNILSYYIHFCQTGFILIQISIRSSRCRSWSIDIHIASQEAAFVLWHFEDWPSTKRRDLPWGLSDSWHTSSSWEAVGVGFWKAPNLENYGKANCPSWCVPFDNFTWHQMTRKSMEKLVFSGIRRAIEQGLTEEEAQYIAKEAPWLRLCSQDRCWFAMSRNVSSQYWLHGRIWSVMWKYRSTWCNCYDINSHCCHANMLLASLIWE